MKHSYAITSAIHAVLIILGLLECCLGWLQLMGLAQSGHILYPATGSFYNPGPFCAFLAAILPVALAGTLKKTNHIVRWTCIVYIILAIGIMPVLMGRTGWIAAVAGCAVVYCGVKKIRRPSTPILMMAFSLILMAAIALFYLKPVSALGRLFLWKTGLNACLESPLTGVGWDNVPGALGRAQEQYFATHPESSFADVAGSPEYAFNEFIQTGIAFGMPVMLLMMTAMTIVAYASWKSRLYGITGFITAFAITCFCSYPLQFKEFALAAGLVAIATGLAAGRVRRFVRYGLCAIIALITATGINSIHNRETTAREWKAMRYAYMHNLSQQDITTLDSLKVKYGRSATFLFDYGKALRENRQYDKSTSVLRQGLEHSSDPMFLNLIGRNYEDTGNIAEAELYYLRSIDRLPSRLYPYYLLCRLYLKPECADTVRFMYTARTLLAMDPKVKSPATQQMRQEISAICDSITATIASENKQRHIFKQ